MRILLICVLIIFSGCAKNSPMLTTDSSDQTGVDLMYVRKGMQTNEVLCIAGEPYKSEDVVVEGQKYSVWYYLTYPTILGQPKLLPSNFTPYIFKDDILIGWGEELFNVTFDIGNAKERDQYEKTQKYTDDAEEWPKTEHVLVSPTAKKQPPITPEEKPPEVKPKEEPKKEPAKHDLWE